jgi:hypothetical protein
MSINGRAAATDTCVLLLSSTVPPIQIWYPLGKLAFSAAIFGEIDNFGLIWHDTSPMPNL